MTIKAKLLSLLLVHLMFCLPQQISCCMLLSHREAEKMRHSRVLVLTIH